MNIPKVEKNIPLPEITKGRKLGSLAVALEGLAKGDSLYFPASEDDRLKVYRNLYSTAKRRGVAITARLDDGGVRIWRK